VYIDFVEFPSDSDASNYSVAFTRSLPAPSGLAFLPYLPDADCANGSNNGTCGMPFGRLFVVTVSSAVEGQTGAAALESAVATYFGTPVDTTAGNSSPAPTNARGATSTVVPSGPCRLLNAADAQTALNGPVGAVRQGGDTCSYPGSAPGASVALEVYDTGRSGFENARSQTPAAASVNGVGDSAFIFTSPAGFVQVSVIKGSTFFVVTVANDRDGQRATRATALAKTIASRIK
jgi:hypothetical protein